MSESDGLIHCLVLDGKGGARALESWDEVNAWKPEDGVMWLHLDRTGEQAERWLPRNSGLGQACLDSLLAEETRPRITSVPGGHLLFLRGVNLNPGADPEDMVALRCFVGGHRLISLRRRTVMAVKDVEQQLAQGHGPSDVMDLVLALSRRIVDRITEAVGDLEESIDDAEDQLAAGDTSRLRSALSDARRQAIKLRRYLLPQREVFTHMLADWADHLGDSQRTRLREIADSMIREVEDLDSSRERAAVAQEELSVHAAETLNRRMYLLATVTVVFLPLGLLTGLLGINVGGIPLAKDETGFEIIAVVIAVVGLAELAVLKLLRVF